MSIINKLKKLIIYYFASEKITLHGRIFNMITSICAVLALLNFFTSPESNDVLAVLCLGIIILLVYANKTRKYRLSSLILVSTVGFAFFPFLYITNEGIAGGQLLYVIFGAAIICLLLSGKDCIIIMTLYLLTTVSYISFDYYNEVSNLNYIVHFTSDEIRYIDNVVGVVVCSIIIGLIIKFQNALYNFEKKKSEDASKAKSDFLSRMSHEIRTPLNAIIGMNNIAMTTNDPARVQDCQAKIDNASKHLLAIINDILDMSKIEADKFELSYSEFDFEKALMSITNVVNFRAEEKCQNFIVNLSKDIPDFILSDELRLSQVITNLLSNAVKFTPENGTVILNVKKIGNEDGEVTLQIEIIDNGIGINLEQQSRLFTSFEQADGGISRKFGGTGLGLAISKRIVELMGGKIWIESEIGIGSKFAFTIKTREGKVKIHTKLSPDINKNNIHILAVDDSIETRLCFMNIMEIHGLPCDTAANGTEALDMIKRCKERPYNIFFIDWKMPEMDGIELTKKIKEITGDNSVVFMISVADWNAIEKEALLVGVRKFVPKPLFPSLLINAVNECLGVESAKADVHALGIENALNFSGHTILIAEDVEINQEIMTAVLEETGVSIDFAGDGRIAVSMFTANPNKYSLILMDIHMPEMDGYEATRIIRAYESNRAKDIPIIAMTANVFREDIENCIAAGMNDHIGKPIDTNGLFEKLSKYLNYGIINNKIQKRSNRDGTEFKK